MTRSIFKLSLVTVVLTVAVTLAGRRHVQQGRQQEAARLRDDNNRLRLKISQQRQAQVAKSAILEPQAKAVVSSGTTSIGISGVEQPVAPADEIPRAAGTEYRQEGQATPVAALQTFAWACDHADAALMQKLIVFDADAREKTAAHFASLPSEERPQSVSFEAMAADLYISDGMNHPYPAAAVLQLARFEPIKPGRVVLRMPDANGNGYEFQQTADGWKLAITMKVVDDYIAETNAAAQAAQRK